MNELGRRKDPGTALAEIMDRALTELHTALPGRARSYSPSKQTATIEIQTKRLFAPPDDTPQERVVEIPDVPVVFPRAGGYCLTLPVAVNDPCLVIFCERDIGGWLQTGQAAVPPTSRRHNFTDAVAIMGLFPSNSPISPSPSASNLQIRNEAGTRLIEIASTYVGISSNVQAQVNAGTDVLIDAGDDVTISAADALTMTGDGLVSLISGLLLSIVSGAGLAISSVGPISVTRGANELLQILSDALDEIGTSTAGGDALSNAAAIAALKAKVDAMRT